MKLVQLEFVRQKKKTVQPNLLKKVLVAIILLKKKVSCISNKSRRIMGSKSTELSKDPVQGNILDARNFVLANNKPKMSQLMKINLLKYL